MGFRLLASWVGFAVLGAFAFLALTPLVPLLPRVVLGVDLAAGMPWWWSASEGPGGVVFGALLFVLARPAYSKGGTA